jgi:hypothetical protein
MPGPGLRFGERKEISWRRDRGEGVRAIGLGRRHGHGYGRNTT